MRRSAPARATPCIRTGRSQIPWGRFAMTLLQLHLILVSFWFGLWAAETVLELSARDAGALRTVAAVHGWIDLIFEGPIAIAVLVTGALLLARLWPASLLHLIHAGLGMVPVIANLACIRWVLARMRETDEARVRALTWKVKLSGFGIPVAMAAFAVAFAFSPARG